MSQLDSTETDLGLFFKKLNFQLAQNASSTSLEAAVDFHYIKFNLTGETLRSFSDLAQIARQEGAHRVCLIVSLVELAPITLQAQLWLADQTSYVAIKVPALEGTEVWVVAQPCQIRLEKLVGIEKPSVPLLVFPPERMDGWMIDHPWEENRPLIPRKNAAVSTAYGSGFFLENPDASKSNTAAERRLLQNDGHFLGDERMALSGDRQRWKYLDLQPARNWLAYDEACHVLRELLKRLDGFYADRDAVLLSELRDLDRWMLSKTSGWIAEVYASFEKGDLSSALTAILRFVRQDVNELYLRLIPRDLCDSSSAGDRSAQSTIFLLTHAMVRLIAPLFPDAAEQAWSSLQSLRSKPASVFGAKFPISAGELRVWRDEELEDRYEEIWSVRDQVKKAVMKARQEKRIGQSTKAKVTLTVDGLTAGVLQSAPEDLGLLLGTERMELKLGEAIQIEVSSA